MMPPRHVLRPGLLYLAIIAPLLFCRPRPGTAAVPAASPSQTQTFQIGVASEDITPTYPIRLSGYAVRKKESEGVAQHLYAKALAIGSDKEGPAILLTVDNVGVPGSVRDEVAARLQKRKGIDPARVALCSSHAHTAPCLAGNLPTLFGEPVPPEHQAHIDRYTRELTDSLEKVALRALANRRPGKLSWGQGTAAFAANRRTKGGPVDHDLPVLVVTDEKNHLRALLANYACHCTTLDGVTNQICGDWAGYAQEYLQRDHPGAIVLTTIGCAADANPQPRPGLDFAKQHGKEIETSVNEILDHTLSPLHSRPDCRIETIQLPFDKPRTREEWQKIAAGTDKYAAYYAKKNLEKLDRGETLPTQLPYRVQTWTFGNELAMVFLSGEVVADYSLRLKKEFDPARLWVNAYANDVPCYIPSERVLKEGGYEGGGAMVYYDRPNRFAPGLENLIIGSVHHLLPPTFLFDEQKAEYPTAKSPRESLATMQTEAGFEVELVASEPLIVDPVAIDWGPDGKLWVVEMRDYPMGMDGKWKPGSRVKYLEATHGDGKYDQATVLLDNLPFATGVTAWRNGVLVCSAPDILYAEPVPGSAGKRAHSGQPNVMVKKVFTGFVTENYQARVNSLSLGLDNWVYGANGLLGGVIHGASTGLLSPAGGLNGAAAPSTEVDIRGRDFRINPDTGEFQPASGLTQQGRVRDDWGNWFGCDNSTLIWHYPVPDHYIRRNPHVAAPSPRVSIASGPDPNLLHPISHLLERFNMPQSANHVTSGCGLGLYRDNLLGADFYGDGFVCDPVHNVVHRLKVQPHGLTFTGPRPKGEEQSEFFASRDNWSRPVQARTGPDGALYVVDMYRFVIEHPRWIPADRLAKLNVRAGDDQGRIYRIVPKGKKLRPIPDLTKLSAVKLAEALDTPNGTERDRVHQELVFSSRRSLAMNNESDPEKIRTTLNHLAIKSQNPAVRVQATCVLDGLGLLDPDVVQHHLSDHSPAVRANAIRLSEHFLPGKNPPGNDSLALAKQLLTLTSDPDLTVRFQLALTLGEWNDPAAGVALGKLAAADLSDPWMRAAILSSAIHAPAEILKPVLTLDSKAAGRSDLIRDLIATAVGEADPASLGKVLAAVAPADAQHRETWQLTALASVLDSLDRKHLSLATLSTNSDAEIRHATESLRPLFAWAHDLAADSKTKDALREPAIRLLGRDDSNQPDDLQLLISLLSQNLSARIQTAAFDSLKHIRRPEVADALLKDWSVRSPSLRQSILEVLLARDEWLPPLFDALEKGAVGANEISPANRQRLLHHSNHAIQQRAETVWKKQDHTRAQVLAKYQSATTLLGDAGKGATVFANTCTPCHSLRGQGHSVGPNLAALADKTPTDFLIAILDPNAVVEPRFIAYNIETKDGRSLTGVVSAETATTLTLVQGGGVQERILRSDIESIRASGLSLMPEGLEANLAPQDLADLIAFLKTSPRAFGSATPEQTAEARKTFLASSPNGVRRITAQVEKLPYPSWLGQLPMHYCRQTDGTQKVAWETAPAPSALPNDGFYTFRLPVGMGLASDPSGTFSLRLNAKPALTFNVSTTDQAWQSPDGNIRLRYTVMENNNEDSNGVLVLEVKNSLLSPGKPLNCEVVGSASNSQRWFGIYELPQHDLGKL